MTNITDECIEIIRELSNYRSGITRIIHTVKQMETKINKTIKKNNVVEKKVIKKPSGFAIPTKISKELSDFMQKKEGEKAART